jgi:hypothetical protein
MNQAERNLLAFLQRCVAPQTEYEYMIHEQDARIIMVLHNRPLKLRGHAQWKLYGIFASEATAATALESLRMAQAREAASEGVVTA